MLTSLEKNKLREPAFARSRQELPKLIFSVSAMLARTPLLEIVADEEKYDRLLIYLSSLRAEVMEVLNERT